MGGGGSNWFEDVSGFKEVMDTFLGLIGGGGGVDLALNSCSVLGFAARRALRSDTSSFKI